MKRRDLHAIARAFPEIGSVVNDPLWKSPQGVQLLRDLQTMVGFGLTFTCVLPQFKGLAGVEQEGWNDDVQQIVDLLTAQPLLFEGKFGEEEDEPTGQKGELVSKTTGLSYEEQEGRRLKRILAGGEQLLPDKDKELKTKVFTTLGTGVASFAANKAFERAFGPKARPDTEEMKAERAHMNREAEAMAKERTRLAEEQQRVLDAIRTLEALRRESQPRPIEAPAAEEAPVPTRRLARGTHLRDMAEAQRRQWFRDRFREYTDEFLVPVIENGKPVEFRTYNGPGMPMTWTCTRPGYEVGNQRKIMSSFYPLDYSDPVAVNQFAREAGIKTFKEFLDDTGVGDYQYYTPDGKTAPTTLRQGVDYGKMRVGDVTLIDMQEGGLGSFVMQQTPGLPQQAPEFKEKESQLFNMSSMFSIWMAILFIAVFWRTWKGKPSSGSSKTPSAAIERLIFKENRPPPANVRREDVRPLLRSPPPPVAVPNILVLTESKKQEAAVARAAARRDQQPAVPLQYTAYARRPPPGANKPTGRSFSAL